MTKGTLQIFLEPYFLVAEGGSEITNYLAKHFSDVYDNSNCTIPDFVVNHNLVIIQNLSFSEVFEFSVYQIWYIWVWQHPQYLLKKLHNITKPQYLLFNKSFQSCCFSNLWKQYSYNENTSNDRFLNSVGNVKIFDSFTNNWFCIPVALLAVFNLAFAGKVAADNLACFQIASLETLERGEQVHWFFQGLNILWQNLWLWIFLLRQLPGSMVWLSLVFSDDLKLYQTIHHRENAAGLQKDLTGKIWSM